MNVFALNVFLHVYNTPQIVGSSYPRIDFNLFHTLSQYLFIFTQCQTIWKWSTLCSPHSLKQSCGTCRSPLFNLGVMKNLTMFFQQISLQVIELVVICSVLHILCHTPLVISLFSSFFPFISYVQFYCTHCTEMQWFRSIHKVNPIRFFKIK